MMRSALTAVLVLLAAAVVAWAAEPTIDRLIEEIKNRRTGVVEAWLDVEEARVWLAANPAETRKLAEFLHGDLDALSADTSSGAIRIVDLSLTAAERCVKENDGSADAHLAEGLLRGDAARARLAGGEKAEAAQFETAATSLEKSYALLPADGMALAHALACLTEAAELGGAAAGGVLDRAVELAGTAHAAHPKTDALTVACAGVRIRAAEASASKKSAAKAHLAVALGLLEPLGARASGPLEMEIATAHNHAVTLNTTAKLGLKVKYVTAKDTAGPGLEFLVPKSRHWAVRSREGSTSIRQRGYEPGKSRYITFDRFDWDTNWTFGNGAEEAGGDNIKGITKCCMRYALSGVEGKNRKEKMGKGPIAKGTYFEVSGKDSKGRLQRIRSFLWKDKGNKVTLQVEIREYGEPDKKDPEFKLFLDSLGE